MPPRSKSWDRGQCVRPTLHLRRFLIICEDTKSALSYLECFPFDRERVEVVHHGTGMNTVSLMEDAIRRMQQAVAAKAPFEAIWVVFDKDDFPEESFNRVFDLASQHPTITACWSNECFELWYLLHFGFHHTAIGRDEIFRKLAHRDRLGRKYDKGDKDIYDLLKSKLPEAIRNASKLAYLNAQEGTRRGNPSTRVHELVGLLQKLAPAPDES